MSDDVLEDSSFMSDEDLLAHLDFYGGVLRRPFRPRTDGSTVAEMAATRLRALLSQQDQK